MHIYIKASHIGDMFLLILFYSGTNTCMTMCISFFFHSWVARGQFLPPPHPVIPFLHCCSWGVIIRVHVVSYVYMLMIILQIYHLLSFWFCEVACSPWNLNLTEVSHWMLSIRLEVNHIWQNWIYHPHYFHFNVSDYLELYFGNLCVTPSDQVRINLSVISNIGTWIWLPRLRMCALLLRFVQDIPVEFDHPYRIIQQNCFQNVDYNQFW